MKRLVIIAAVVIAPFGANAQKIGDIINGVVDGVSNNNGSGLTNADIIGGLKEALTIGSNNSSKKASAVDGFFKNPLIRIPFPPEAKKVENLAKELGMTTQVNRFVMTLNRAAETAAKDAAPIFVNAVKALTINDGLQILNGNSTSTQEQGFQGEGSRNIQWGWNPVGGASSFDVALTPNYLALTVEIGTVTVVTT
jgi:hypothetical protein